MSFDTDNAAQLLKAIAHPIRLSILQELSSGAKCVMDLQELVTDTQPSVSKHLQVLRDIQVVGFHKDGKSRCYYITQPSLVKHLLKLLATEHKIKFRSPKAVYREVLCVYD